MIMLQIIDISSNILYDKSKTQNQFLSIINATVSHEMRNPMNSIKAENTLKKELIIQLKELLEKEFTSIEDFKEESAEILSKLEYSVSI